MLICDNIQDPGNLGTIMRTAEAAGVSLGRVISLTESVAQGPVPYRARADMAMEAAPVAEGTVTLGAEVEVVYGLE